MADFSPSAELIIERERTKLKTIYLEIERVKTKQCQALAEAACEKMLLTVSPNMYMQYMAKRYGVCQEFK